MAKAEIRAEIIGANKIKQYLKTIGNRIDRVSDTMRAAFMTAGFKDIIDHFQKERGPESSWKPWSPAYAAFRNSKRGRRQSATEKILQLTGNLRKSLLPSTGNIRKKGKSSILVFSNVEYSGKHEYGDRKNNIPERSFMWLSDKAKEDINEIILDQLVKD